MTDQPKQKPICEACGSEDILVDAYASWDVETQKYVLHSTYDDTRCNDCGGENTERWEDIE